MPHDHAIPGAMPVAQAARITKRTAFAAIAIAGTLMLVKAWAFWMSGSVSMLASLVDSGLDAAASIFTLLAVSYAAMPADDEHRFGHGKAEAFAAMFQSVLIGASATLVAIEAINRFRNPEPLLNGPIAIAVMVLSIALTLGLITIQTRAVRQTGSVATEGDRAHYMADFAANLAVIAGIGATAFLGLRWADPLIGLGVAIWLAISAFEVARHGFDQLLDHELPDEAREQIRQLALSGGDITAIHELRTRASGPYIHIQFHADIDAELSVAEAHDVMVAAEARILEAFPAADILIHPDPAGMDVTHGLKEFRQSEDHENA